MKQWMVASRSLARRPGFTAAAILILALGIGANTAMFSLVDAVLFKPLPYPNPERLVSLLEASPAKHQNDSLIAPGRLEDWNRMNRTFQSIGGSYSDSVTDTSGPEPERLNARGVSPRYFSVFQSKPQIGRTFTHEEDLNGGPGAVVISDSFWTRRFHRDPKAIGRRLTLGRAGFTIVGVMQKEFASSTIDLWMPSQFGPFLMGLRDNRFYSGVGRLKPDVTIAQAREDLVRVQRELGRQYPRTDQGWSALVRDLKESRVGERRKALLFVFGAVALFLLIALANIAGLMLTQLHRRARELAIRSSIGATRLQVAGAVMRETLLIAAAGAALGCAAAAWLVDVLAKFFTDLPHSAALDLDWRAFSFAALSGALAAVLCGLLPALQATRADVSSLLSQAGRGGSGVRHKWQSGLVSAQIAVTVILLSSAGLMLRSYYNLSHVDLGFEPEHAITFHVGAAWDEDRKRVGQMQEELLEKLRRFPGVESAGFTNFLPVSGATLRYQLTLEGNAQTEERGRITVGERSITEGYPAAMGARLLAGRSCPEPRAIPHASPRALVSGRFASLYGGGRTLVGRHLLWSQDQLAMPPAEIVGVISDMREDTLNVTPAPYVYLCISPGDWPDPEYVVRTHGDSRALLHAIGPIVHSADPGRAVFGTKTLEDVMQGVLEQPRLNTGMLALFAAAAMLLASIGLYTLVTLIVTSRTREIGVRMTLGAEPGQIMTEVILGVARLLASGIAAGLVLTLLADRLLRSVLFGVSPMDTMTLAAVVLLLALVSALATVAPARRAATIDPLEAIRAE